MAAENTDRTQNLKPWQPGQSGNPGGRPKGAARRAREAVGNDPNTVYEVFRTILFDESEKTADRINVGKELLDRGWGKSSSHAPIEGGDPLELDDVDRAIGAVLDELAERREAKTPSPSTNGKVAAAGEAGATAA